MLSHHHSLAYQFVTTHFELLLGIAFAWALVITFLFSNNWRRSRNLIVRVIEMSINAIMIALLINLPFLALALAVKWGWFY